jgi:hypothetical protein
MAKFLTTTGISYRLEEIIRSATDRLVIISPFLRINDRLKELLEDKDRLKIDVRVVYGKKELQPDEDNWLESMNYIRTSSCKNLHAKCYLNESEALLTSMNLYEFSQVNNNEMGILVSRGEEPVLYNEILEESMRLVRVSQEIRVKVAKVDSTEKDKERSQAKQTGTEPQNGRQDCPSPEALTTLEKPQNGYCIRCKTELPANPRQPYCRRCFQSWKEYQNKSHKEVYCHTSAERSMLRRSCVRSVMIVS